MTRPLYGITLKLLSVVVFTAMAAAIKATADTIPTGQAVFFRSFFAIPVILLWLVWLRDLPHGLETKAPLGHLWRGLVGVSAMGLGFAGLGLLPLPEVTAIGYARPLLTVILAAMFLGEVIRLFRLSAVLLGLVGVLIVLSPRLTGFASGAEAETLGAVLVLMSATLAALAQVFVRKLVQTETTSAIVFYFSVTASVMALVTLRFGWVWPSWEDAVILISAGVMGALGQILMTSSYRYAETSVIAPFDYASMLLAIAVGFWIFGEVPTVTVLVGASLVVAAGLLIIWREHRLGLERGKARRLLTPQG
ncbi:MAG: DMT family transporter [Pseudomonadota bacterium]